MRLIATHNIITVVRCSGGGGAVMRLSVREWFIERKTAACFFSFLTSGMALWRARGVSSLCGMCRVKVVVRESFTFSLFT